MVIDDGLPTDYVRDVLRTSSAYIDLMKIKTGTVKRVAVLMLTKNQFSKVFQNHKIAKIRF